MHPPLPGGGAPAGVTVPHDFGKTGRKNNMSNQHESRKKRATRTVALVIAGVMVFTVIAAAILSQL